MRGATSPGKNPADTTGNLPSDAVSAPRVAVLQQVKKIRPPSAGRRNFLKSPTSRLAAPRTNPKSQKASGLRQRFDGEKTGNVAPALIQKKVGGHPGRMRAGRDAARVPWRGSRQIGSEDFTP